MKEAVEPMDAWNPGNEDPYWMLEIRQGFENAGAWLKNDRTFSVTRDPLKAIRYPSQFEADCARRRLPGLESHRFEPTEHAWIATPPLSGDYAELVSWFERFIAEQWNNENGITEKQLRSLQNVSDAITALQRRLAEVEGDNGKLRLLLDEAESWLAINSTVNHEKLCEKIRSVLSTDKS